MIQISLFDNINNNYKTKQKQPTYSQTEKIWENIKEWNTIEDIELYKPLYKLYSQLFMLTLNHKLACLNYYIEDDEMFAEIENTWDLSLKERYNLHQQLINRIKNNDPTLEYAEKVIDSDTPTLFSFL